MHVLFVEPCFPAYQAKFVHALASVGARVTGIGERPVAALPAEVKRALHHYVRVTNVCDERAMFKAVRQCQQREWVDRLEATIEAHILPVAKVREACKIPGTSVKSAYLCRDKPAMKEALRRAGVPCAMSTAAASAAEVRDFVEEVGLPVIVKPADAAGAAGAYKVTRPEELPAAIEASGAADGARVAVEEFIEGHEGFYDTICVNGQVMHEFISHYYPNVLHAMRTRWISPQVVTTNRIFESSYDELKVMSARVIAALELGTTATHMEWFFGDKGLKFSEIGCRPPGVGMWDVYCAANDFDIYREWAMAIVHGKPAQIPSRQYAAGMIAFRPEADGVIAGYDGVDAVLERYRGNLIDYSFPRPGTPTQPIEGGFWANAWLRARHPDYDGLRAMLDEMGKTVRVRVRR